ncbi:MAG: FecR domain-containing protein [Pseudomonadota bacterium]
MIDQNKLRDEAVSIVLRLQDDDSPRAQALADEWTSRSKAHRRAFMEARDTWSAFSALPSPALSTRERLALRAQSRVASFRDHPQRLLATSGMAAALLLGLYLGFSQSLPSNQSEPAPTVAKITAFDVTYQSTRGQIVNQTLPDGTEIWLDWNTHIDVAYSGSARHISLYSGKARFKVASDAARPFTVKVGDVDATALGTEFIVNKLGHQRVEVAVREGLVAVAYGQAQSPEELAPSEVLRIEGGELGARFYRDIVEMGSWSEGVLVFNNRPLIDALAALGPYLPYELDTQAVIDPQRAVSGTFLTSRAEEALSAMMAAYQIEVWQQRGSLVELRSATLDRPAID